MPSANAEDLFNKSFSLYHEARITKPIRSLGVRASGLSVQEHVQLSLLPEERDMQRQDRLERVVEELRERYGRISVQRGIMYTDTTLSRLDPENDHPSYPVGFQGLRE